MNKIFEFQQQIKFRDFLTIVYFYVLARRYGFLTYALVVWLSSLTLFYIFSSNTSFNWQIYVLPLLLSAIVLSFGYFYIRKMWDRERIISEATTCIITNETLTLASPLNKVEYSWSQFIDAFSTGRSVILIRNGYGWLAFPKMAFIESEFQEFKELVFHQVRVDSFKKNKRSHGRLVIVFTLSIMVFIPILYKLSCR